MWFRVDFGYYTRENSISEHYAGRYGFVQAVSFDEAMKKAKAYFHKHPLRHLKIHSVVPVDFIPTCGILE